MIKENIQKYLQLVDKKVLLENQKIVYITRNGKFSITAEKCTHNLKHKTDLMNLWKKYGFINKTYPTHISISTEYQTEDNKAYKWYNITTKHSDDGKRTVLNFDYLREWNEDNIEDLVAECISLYEMDIRS